MMDYLEGCLDNISTAATQTVAKGGPLAEIAASLVISVGTTARRQQEIKRLYKKDQCFEKKRYACRQHRNIARRKTGGDDCMHTL